MTLTLAEMDEQTLRRWVYEELASRVYDHEVLGLYGTDTDDDGRIVKYFDLVGGKTGVQVIDHDGTAGPIRRVD